MIGFPKKKKKIEQYANLFGVISRVDLETSLKTFPYAQSLAARESIRTSECDPRSANV
jgi:hypothetical protein